MGDIQAAKSDIVEAEDLEETGDEFGGASSVKQDPLDQQDHEEPQDPKDPQDTLNHKDRLEPQDPPALRNRLEFDIISLIEIEAMLEYLYLDICPIQNPATS